MIFIVGYLFLSDFFSSFSRPTLDNSNQVYSAELDSKNSQTKY